MKPWWEEEGAIPLPRRRTIGPWPDYSLLDTHDLGPLSDDLPENDANPAECACISTLDRVTESDAAGILPPAAPPAYSPQRLGTGEGERP